MTSSTHVGWLYPREAGAIRYPIYMTPDWKLFFIDEMRKKQIQIWLPLKYELGLAINYSNLEIMLDWSMTYAEYAANNHAGFPNIKINGTVVKNKQGEGEGPRDRIITYCDPTCDLMTHAAVGRADDEKNPYVAKIRADDMRNRVMDEYAPAPAPAPAPTRVENWLTMAGKCLPFKMAYDDTVGNQSEKYAFNLP